MNSIKENVTKIKTGLYVVIVIILNSFGIYLTTTLLFVVGHREEGSRTFPYLQMESCHRERTNNSA